MRKIKREAPEQFSYFLSWSSCKNSYPTTLKLKIICCSWNDGWSLSQHSAHIVLAEWSLGANWNVIYNTRTFGAWCAPYHRNNRKLWNDILLISHTVSYGSRNTCLIFLKYRSRLWSEYKAQIGHNISMKVIIFLHKMGIHTSLLVNFNYICNQVQKIQTFHQNFFLRM